MDAKPYDADLSFVYNNPTRICFGEDVGEDAGIEMEPLGCSKALLVTDKPLREHTDVVERIEKALGKKLAGVFDDVVADSGVHVCEAGAAYGKKVGADCLVSVGGGSAIDSAKGIAILLREGGSLRDYVGFQNLTRPQTPHIAIPTTAGTGSEVTYAAVIKDHERKQKLVFGSNYITPNVALLDPTLTVGLPPLLTAATGMDAMSHAVEALCSQQREPISDGLALHAIRLIAAYIERATTKGDDLEARGQMLIAANMAGVAFGNAQVGLIHAMAHTVGGRFSVHHGTANALFMPHVLRFNAEDCADVCRAVATALPIDTADLDDEAAVDAAATYLFELNGKLGLPQRLRDTAVEESALESLAEATLYDGSIVYNGRMVMDPAEILAVYRTSW